MHLVYDRPCCAVSVFARFLVGNHGQGLHHKLETSACSCALSTHRNHNGTIIYGIYSTTDLRMPWLAYACACLSTHTSTTARRTPVPLKGPIWRFLSCTRSTSKYLFAPFNNQIESALLESLTSFLVQVPCHLVQSQWPQHLCHSKGKRTINFTAAVNGDLSLVFVLGMKVPTRTTNKQLGLYALRHKTMSPA